MSQAARKHARPALASCCLPSSANRQLGPRRATRTTSYGSHLPHFRPRLTTTRFLLQVRLKLCKQHTLKFDSPEKPATFTYEPAASSKGTAALPADTAAYGAPWEHADHPTVQKARHDQSPPVHPATHVSDSE